MILPVLFIAHSHNRGRGVFTDEDIPAKTTIEISPVIVFSSKEREHIEDTQLFNYIFEWGVNKKKGALGLGYISMYNHSYDANCEYEMDYEASIITVRTVKHIKEGEELFINYNAIPDDATPLWFDAN